MKTAPGLTVCILKIGIPAFRLNIGQGFPIQIPAFFPDHFPEIFCHRENIFHHLSRILKHMNIHPLQHITGHIRPLRSRHINSIRLINMTFTKGLHIAALRTEAKGIDRILQTAAVRPLNLPSGGENHLTGLHLSAGFNSTVGLHNTSQSHMSTGTYNRIMVHHSAAVNQGCPLDSGVSIDHRPLHDKAAGLQHSAGTDYSRRMHQSRNLISCCQKPVRPV